MYVTFLEKSRLLSTHRVSAEWGKVQQWHAWFDTEGTSSLRNGELGTFSHFYTLTLLHTHAFIVSTERVKHCSKRWNTLTPIQLYFRHLKRSCGQCQKANWFCSHKPNLSAQLCATQLTAISCCYCLLADGCLMVQWMWPAVLTFSLALFEWHLLTLVAEAEKLHFHALNPSNCCLSGKVCQHLSNSPLQF